MNVTLTKLILGIALIMLSACNKAENKESNVPQSGNQSIAGINNSPPTILFNWPDKNVSIPDGSHLNISWLARDLDDNAKISIKVVLGPLLACSSGYTIATNLSEDTISNFTIDTSSFPYTSFVVCLTIDDTFSNAVEVKSSVITKVATATAPKISSPTINTTMAYHNGIKIRWQDFNSYSAHTITLKTSITNTGTCSGGITLLPSISDSEKSDYFDFIPSTFAVPAGDTYICMIYNDNQGKVLYSFSPKITITAPNLNTTSQVDFDTTIPVGSQLHAGAVGNSTFWGLGGNTNHLSLPFSMPTNSFTLEFGLKIPTTSNQFQGMDELALSKDYYTIFNAPNFVLELSPSLGWQGTFKINGTQTSFNIWLDGINENSFAHLADGNWHHIAVIWDGAIGKTQLLVDGKRPTPFMQSVKEGSLANLSGLVYLGDKFFGDIDQIAITDRVLPQNLLLNHSQRLLTGLAYNNSTAIVPAFTNNLYDILPVIYTTASAPASNGLDVLRNLPVPLIKASTSLKRNRLVFQGRYLAQNGNLETDAVLNQRETTIQDELAKFYHFTHLLSPNQYQTIDESNDLMLSLANSSPSVPLGLWSGYKELQNRFIDDFSLLPNSLRLTNLANQFISCSGLSGGRCPSPFPALGLFAEDAYQRADQYTPYLDLLTRNVDFIQEGRDFLNWDISGYKINQRAINLRNEMELSWETFEARNMARLYHSYAFELKNYQYANANNIQNAPFMMMDVAGRNSFKRSFSEMQAVNDTLSGEVYPTPLFSPLQVYHWKKTQTGSSGLASIWSSRQKEKTTFFAPFVSAHQLNGMSSTLPPFNYLANLKFMAVWGADFFNVGFNFSANENTDTRDIIWSIAAAGLVHGALSYADDILQGGNYLVYESNKKDFQITDAAIETPVGVRKHLVLEKYLITTAVMPSSVKNGSVPTNKTVSLILSGKTITLTARPQGSLYYFDNTGAAPTLMQLDSFHETIHPERWNKTTTIEAELYDSIGANTATRETSPNVGLSLNYSVFETSLMNINANNEITYNYTPNEAGDFELKGRVKTTGITTFTFDLYDPNISLVAPVATISSIQNTSGSYSLLSFGTFTGLSRKNYILKIKVNAAGTSWDYYSLSSL